MGGEGLLQVLGPGEGLVRASGGHVAANLNQQDAPHPPDQPPLRPFCCRESLLASHNPSSLPACEEARRPNDFMQACAELCRLDVGVGKRGPPAAAV
jgi:hypothetical protein